MNFCRFLCPHQATMGYVHSLLPFAMSSTHFGTIRVNVYLLFIRFFKRWNLFLHFKNVGNGNRTEKRTSFIITIILSYVHLLGKCSMQKHYKQHTQNYALPCWGRERMNRDRFNVTTFFWFSTQFNKSSSNFM